MRTFLAVLAVLALWAGGAWVLTWPLRARGFSTMMALGDQVAAAALIDGVGLIMIAGGLLVIVALMRRPERAPSAIPRTSRPETGPDAFRA